MSVPDGTPAPVVIGASAGGIEPLIRLFDLLGTRSRLAFFVAVHISEAGSALPVVIGSRAQMPVRFGLDGEQIEGGTVYVAPPGAHLIIAGDRIRTLAGPRENGHRPAIDPLFRGAAAVAGPFVTGILLSGALDDGVAGLAAIAKAGGRVLVQDPAEALHPSMPRNAIERVAVDAVLPIDEIARELGAAWAEDDRRRRRRTNGGAGSRSSGRPNPARAATSRWNGWTGSEIPPG